jgi:hypothetical protein
MLFYISIEEEHADFEEIGDVGMHITSMMT